MFVELNLDANEENEIQLLQYKNAGVNHKISNSNRILKNSSGRLKPRTFKHKIT